MGFSQWLFDGLLVLFTDCLGVGFAVGIEEFLAALLPSGFEFGRGDVPIGPALLGDGTQVLTEILHSGPAEEPVAIVDLVDDQTGFKDNHVGDHGIIGGIGVFGDVEVLLNHARRVGEKRPVGSDATPVFIGLSDVVGADGDETAIADLEFAMEFHKQFSLAAILRAETTAAEDENHGMWSLQLGELAMFAGVVGKLEVGEDGPWNNVRSHKKPLALDARHRVMSQ